MSDQLDQAKIEQFAGTMMGILNGGMLALLTSIGYHTGIFETMAGKRPSTAEEIGKARAATSRDTTFATRRSTRGGPKRSRVA
jgi:hypothetical protein